MDVKTVTVSGKTHRELEELKEKTRTKSMFGAAKGIRSGFSREHKERD